MRPDILTLQIAQTHMKQLTVQDISVSIAVHDAGDYISLTDIARFRNAVEPKDVVKN